MGTRWHSPAGAGRAHPGPPALPHGTAGWFCYMNGVDNAGCLFPHLSPRSLSTHALASPTADSNLTWEQNSSEFCFNTRKGVSHVAGEDAANREERAREEDFKDHKIGGGSVTVWSRMMCWHRLPGRAGSLCRH